MKISIVIPAYNEEEWLAPTIEAALAQDYPDFEVIVVDNASTDRTSEVVKRYPVILVREERKGLPYARECGRAHAKGEILANMDADCLPGKDWLSRGAEFFKDPKVVAAAGPYYYYDASKTFRALHFASMKYLLVPLNIVLGYIGLGGYLSGGSTFIRASALESVGGYDTSIEFWGEDQRTAKILSKSGKLIFSTKLAVQSSARRFKSNMTKTIFIYIYDCTIKNIFSLNDNK